MKQATKTKNGYQRMIAEYKTRRQRLRDKYNWRPGKPCPQYREEVRNIQKKLSLWKRAIKRIEVRQAALKVIAQHLEEFSGCNVHHAIRSQDRDVILARSIFYKYCLEQGFHSPDIMYFVGGTSRYWATHARRKFTQSLKTNMHHQVTWHRFMAYMKDQQPKTLKVA